ncbi:MAG: hypothetical protein AAF242_00170 [Bacteroidota bacterium]
MKKSVQFKYDEMLALSDILSFIVAENHLYDHLLHYLIITELYAQKIGYFTYIRPRRISFKQSELLALKEYLLKFPINDAQLDIMRNHLIEKFSKHLSHA